jgi:transmembrane sensor
VHPNARRARHRGRRFSSADELELARWRCSDPRCEAAWQRLNGSLAAFRVTANQGLPKGTLARSVLRTSVDRRSAIKSCLAFGLIGAGGLSIADQFFPLGDLLADLRTDTAERRTYKLADGSSAVLGARSAADTEFRIEHRILSLRDGVVMVDIQSDPRAPSSFARRRYRLLRTTDRWWCVAMAPLPPRA